MLFSGSFILFVFYTYDPFLGYFFEYWEWYGLDCIFYVFLQFCSVCWRACSSTPTLGYCSQVVHYTRMCSWMSRICFVPPICSPYFYPHHIIPASVTFEWVLNLAESPILALASQMPELQACKSTPASTSLFSTSLLTMSFDFPYF